MSESNILSADEIWASDDIEEKVIEVPEWRTKSGEPGSVKIRALSLRQIAGIAQKSIKRNPQTGQDETSREQSVILTLLEGMIEPKLSPADARRMADKSAGAVTRIVQAINALGSTPEAVDEAEKSLWPESDAEVPVPIGSRARDDVGAVDNGHVNVGVHALDSSLPDRAT
jgi:hypothetical protein